MTLYEVIYSFTMTLSILRLYKWPNYATSNHWDTKKIKTIRYFIFFLNFDLANGRVSAL